MYLLDICCNIKIGLGILFVIVFYLGIFVNVKDYYLLDHYEEAENFINGYILHI